MNVLSLFNGFGGAFLAFEKANVKVNKLYVSEIDAHAIKAANAINPSNINLGDIRNINISKLDKIDILVGGSPCQSFSFAGKRKGMETIDNVKITTLAQYINLKQQNFEFLGQSYLFWEYMRILTDIRKCNQDVIFFLENVVMAKDWEQILSEAIGIKPIMVNSSLVSAQNRKRLYWSNIKTRQEGLFENVVQNIEQPADKGILLKDILVDDVDNKYYLINSNFENIDFVVTGCDYRSNEGFRDRANGKSGTLTARAREDESCGQLVKYVAMRERNPENPKSRESGLNTVQKDNLIMKVPEATKKGYTTIRRLTPRECFRLQTVAENHIDTLLNCGVSKSQLYKMCGNGWTIDVIAHFFKNIKA